MKSFYSVFSKNPDAVNPKLSWRTQEHHRNARLTCHTEPAQATQYIDIGQKAQNIIGNEDGLEVRFRSFQ
jgi:hypothetical protein